MDTPLGFNFVFRDLIQEHAPERLDEIFMAWFARRAPDPHQRLVAARANPHDIPDRDHAELLLDMAPHIDHFIGELFAIGDQIETRSRQQLRRASVAEAKRLFVQRRAYRDYSASQAADLDGEELLREMRRLLGHAPEELELAEAIIEWRKSANDSALDLAARYCAWAGLTAAGRAAHAGWELFGAPKKLDSGHLIPGLVTSSEQEYLRHRFANEMHRPRDGFSLTDPGRTLEQAMDQAHYCIWCHERDKDSCSKGLREKRTSASVDVSFKHNALGVELSGCPLGERISEFQMAKARGSVIAPLAIIMIDNPMVAATGHRICNDCTKSCIYQKQEPVDIPGVETRTLRDVLELDFGFEILYLLARFNPMNIKRPVPAEPTGKRVLVVGMGPAGFTVAHHLLNDGHTVVGIDGLKIEPVRPALADVAACEEPVKRLEALAEDLDERTNSGFGGVAEYGITVRWDKNFLTVVRLMLERRARFAMFGGVRFGGTLTVDDAWQAGFDHIAMAMGAGRPTVIDMPNALVRGVRTASDFLMALQLTGAAKRRSLANMQLRLPVVVIGGGLTAIDTATEALAYYPRQVEKFLCRYERLVAATGEAAVRNAWDARETAIADEFLAHARMLREERDAALADNRPVNFLPLLRRFGGATIAYRKRLVDSPAYTLNHEEVAKALEEGIEIAECLSPVAIETDESRDCQAVLLDHMRNGEHGWEPAGRARLPARSVFMAAGTRPNNVIASESPSGMFHQSGKYFLPIGDDGEPLAPTDEGAKPVTTRVFASRDTHDRFISYLGDLHPNFSGNVVKAMASAKRGAPEISRVLAPLPTRDAGADQVFRADLADRLTAVVSAVNRLTPDIVEVVIRAPQAAKRFRPGQFFRLQNFETDAHTAGHTILAMEGLAMTGAWVDVERGLVAVIALEMGGSSDLCAGLEPGQRVVLMGPTGSPTDIPARQTVLLVGGGLGNAVLFSIGRALRGAGSKVLYFAGYKQPRDRYKVAEIEAAADQIVWCCDREPAFVPEREGDLSFVGNIVEAMLAYSRGELGAARIPLAAVRQMVVIGSDRMMAAVARARHGVLREAFDPSHVAIGSINSPMQCMMKEICAQCLQTHRDPETGAVHNVFSCSNQDQPLDCVDWTMLNERLTQNSVQEKLTVRWLTALQAGMSDNGQSSAR